MQRAGAHSQCPQSLPGLGSNALGCPQRRLAKQGGFPAASRPLAASMGSSKDAVVHEDLGDVTQALPRRLVRTWPPGS